MTDMLNEEESCIKGCAQAAVCSFTGQQAGGGEFLHDRRQEATRVNGLNIMNGSLPAVRFYSSKLNRSLESYFTPENTSL